MSKFLIIGLIILMVGVISWMLLAGNKPMPFGSQQVNEGPAISDPPPVVAENEVTVPLLTQNNSNELGKAVLTQVRGQVQVHLDLKGQPAGSSQPAHIHLGACPTPGTVKYPLSPVVNGVSDTTLNVTIETVKNQLPLAINVHKSEAESSVYVACGDVKF